ncbi:MAG: hypothetical protein PVG03_06780 [Desulfarculaceae bacterium]|jgi:hypothetical protein
MSEIWAGILQGPDKAQTSTKAAPGSLAELSPGRTVRALVLGMGHGGLAKISLLGTTVLAETRVPLKPGQSLTLTVEEVSPRIVLSLGQGSGPSQRLVLALQESQQATRKLASSLSRLLKFDLQKAPLPTGKASELAARLKELAAEMVIGPKAVGDTKALPRSLAAAGWDMESRLARRVVQGKSGTFPSANLRTLSWMLSRELAGNLSLLTAQEPSRAAAIKDFAQAAAELVHSFEANQRLNAQLWPQRDQLLLALPFAFGDRLEQGELLLELPAQPDEGPEGRETKLAFFLSFSALGPVAIEAALRKKMVRGHIFTTTPQAQAFLKTRLPRLYQGLEKAGFKGNFEVRLSPRLDPKTDSPQAALIRQGHYISIKV